MGWVSNPVQASISPAVLSQLELALVTAIIAAKLVLNSAIHICEAHFILHFSVCSGILNLKGSVIFFNLLPALHAGRLFQLDLHDVFPVERRNNRNYACLLVTSGTMRSLVPECKAGISLTYLIKGHVC